MAAGGVTLGQVRAVEREMQAALTAVLRRLGQRRRMWRGASRSKLAGRAGDSAGLGAVGWFVALRIGQNRLGLIVMNWAFEPELFRASARVGLPQGWRWSLPTDPLGSPSWGADPLEAAYMPLVCRPYSSTRRMV